MKIMNLTGEDFSLVNPATKAVVGHLPRQRAICRTRTTDRPTGAIIVLGEGAVLPVTKRVAGEIGDQVPPPQEGVIYLVSEAERAAAARSGRRDIFVPVVGLFASPYRPAQLVGLSEVYPD